MQCESDGDSDPRIDVEAEQSHAIIDHEELHEERCALKDRDIASRCATDGWGFGSTGQCHEKAEDTTTCKADQGQCDGPLQALHEEE